MLYLNIYLMGGGGALAINKSGTRECFLINGNRPPAPYYNKPPKQRAIIYMRATGLCEDSE